MVTHLARFKGTMIYFREDIRLNDIRYNTLLPIAITGYISLKRNVK